MLNLCKIMSFPTKFSFAVFLIFSFTCVCTAMINPRNVFAEIRDVKDLNDKYIEKDTDNDGQTDLITFFDANGKI